MSKHASRSIEASFEPAMNRCTSRFRALTVWQPWASLIIAGFKPYEFRRWCAPKSMVGQTIVVHAATRKCRREDLLDIIEDPTLTCLNGNYEGARRLVRDELEAPGTLPISAAIGTITLGPPVWVADLPNLPIPPDQVDHDMWAWPMLKPQALPAPVPMRGKQGFWLCGEAL